MEDARPPQCFFEFCTCAQTVCLIFLRNVVSGIFLMAIMTIQLIPLFLAQSSLFEVLCLNLALNLPVGYS